MTRYSIGQELYEAGYSHYLAFALPFSDGTFKALTIQTKFDGGFSSQHKAFIEQLIPHIAAVVEHYSQRQFAETLVATFVGKRAGEKVLSGQVHRGDGEFIEAVILMSDLRGFTQFAASHPSDILLNAINQYFEVLTEAVEVNSGEVLKFIGDAVLAIFPVVADKTTALANAEVAVKYAIDKKKTADWPVGLDFGMGLHIGEVFYGNVGGLTRLDFTVIGQAVNLVSRIEALCRELDAPYLVTEKIHTLSNLNYELAGEHLLKGVQHPVKVYKLL